MVFGLIDVKGVGSGSLSIVDQADTPESELIREKLAAVELLELEPGLDSEAQARLKVAAGELDYLVLIPQGFGRGGSQAEPSLPPIVRLLYQSRNGQRNQLVDGLVRNVVAEIHDGKLPLPLSRLVVSEVIQVPEVDYFDQVLMGLIGLGIMTNSIISIAVRVSTYRNQAILKRLLVTPLPIWKYFVGEVTAHLALAAVQVAIIMLAGVFVFGAQHSRQRSLDFPDSAARQSGVLEYRVHSVGVGPNPGGGLGNGQRGCAADDVLLPAPFFLPRPCPGCCLTPPTPCR